MMENRIKTPSKGESRIIKFMILLGIFSILNFLYYFFQPEHVGNQFLFVLLTITILYSILKKLYMWYNYSNISVPDTPASTPQFKVDILTTYFPGEPYQMTITTLEAINQITYPHTTYLCDEANDPYLKRFCEENGIIHVTRDNRINAKAGNINNTLYKYAKGDICVVLDPDHIPEPNFLDPILPHFENPEIGFVQIVQSYYNIKETLVARGAAEQTFQFYGPMMMTLNAYGAVNAIGANCVFRRSALDSIGGHAPGLCEDMHTAMLLYSNGWKAVYLPEVLARGLAPSNLTNFFKQQLKWSRGTFDLLVHVYPKVFSKLTGRQKIHYGILPLHYFAGVTILINFLIPILSLFLTATPWEGNIIDFALVLLPVAASSVLIRTFIQKWVIEKNERGFHLVGGLLHINTWWIYLVGLVYTIINKKVPYLPTPKENEWNTNYKIIIPNAVVAAISILAVVYGLSMDLTPFSLVMAGFALFNSFIMLFGIYLTNKVTNQNRILRRALSKSKVSLLYNVKQKGRELAGVSFMVTRKLALPLLLILLISTMGLKKYNDLSKWENVEGIAFKKESGRYIGIFQPENESGLSDLNEITFIENDQDVNFNIISHYVAWGDKDLKNFPFEELEETFEKNAYPMITWEPWVSELAKLDTIASLKNEKKALKYIAEGHFDEYVISFINLLKTYDKPIFIRFAHEFDNPQYPWSVKGNNTPEEFKAAWIHLHDLIQSQGANKIILVWNPWKPKAVAKYYPGDKYVDWIGVTSLNYSLLNGTEKEESFEDIYAPFHKAFAKFARKPVMLAEFGSLKIKTNQKEWIEDAIKSLQKKYESISALVFFNSKFDKNIPQNTFYNENYLDWTTSNFNSFIEDYKPTPLNKTLDPINFTSRTTIKNPIGTHSILGVNYKKGKKWEDNYYTLTKDVLEVDFRLIRDAGFNTVQLSASDIYIYNLLKYSKEYNLQVVYEFEVDKTMNFTENQDQLKTLKDQIIKKVKRFKNQKNILGYTFSYDFEKYFYKPLLFEQREAYLNWLQTVVFEIKKIDSSKTIVLELELSSETLKNIKDLEKLKLFDSYGINISEESLISEFQKISKELGNKIYISSLEPGLLIDHSSTFLNNNFVLANWQDERYSNWLTFDGLVDQNGNQKQTLGEVKGLLTNGSVSTVDIPIRILKPAEPLYPEVASSFKAVYFKNGLWKSATEDPKLFSYDWKLLKVDQFENPLATLELGSGPTIDVSIPENYKNYRLILTAKNLKNGYTTYTSTKLNTELPTD